MQTLPDRPCRPGGVLVVGINPSPVSVEKGHYYQGNHGRRLWKPLSELGLLSGATDGREDDAFVAAGNGLTDLVKRPTTKAAELSPEELANGVAALRKKVEEWKPGLILFVYKPPAEYLLGSAHVRPGCCSDFAGVPTFLLSGPYAPASEADRVNSELKSLLASPDTPCRREIRESTALLDDGGSLPPPGHEDGDVGQTQTVTPIDMENRRIRLPRPAKKFFLDHRAEVKVDLRGEVLQARYDPRVGPDRERSATLVFQKSVAHLVRENEKLAVTLGPTGLVCLR